MREIIALMLLIVLLVAGLGVMVWYLFIGHNWNVAATELDDTFGELDGYTVIAYEGQTPVPAKEPRLSTTRERIAWSMLDEQNRGDTSVPVESKEGEVVAIEDVADSYWEKGALFFTVHPDEPFRYKEPIIVRKHGTSVAIFTIDERITTRGMEIKAQMLRFQGADIVVAVVTNREHLLGTTPGVDVVMFTKDEDIKAGGIDVGGTLLVDSPYRGHVQVVMVSPANVYSSKTIESM